jgi:hypothetical protein
LSILPKSTKVGLFYQDKMAAKAAEGKQLFEAGEKW